MPKRNNPFGDHSSLQLKTHVGEKEVDKGVCQQTRMQTVYERTQALLFRGMKESQDADMAVDMNENHVTHKGGHGLSSSLIDDSGSSLLKQTHLSKNCELLYSEGNGQAVDMDMEFQAVLPSSNVQNGFAHGSPSSAFCFGELSKDGGCQGTLMPSNGLSCFGRNTGALSPEISACLPTWDNLKGNHTSVASNSNAFSMLMQGSTRQPEQNDKATNRACHNCRQPVQVRSVVKCQFCEQYICSGCVRQCLGCFQHFCQLCSVVNYDESCERAYCLTCRQNNGR